jgi:serine phosphatase RsbU (regulator of sigma subunit)/anti-sigma regulatory factor (Ser/Thr protein kinase)
MSEAQLSTVFRLTLPCDLAAVRGAALAARNFLAEEGIAEDDLIACELALVEGCNNAILYAPLRSRDSPVEIQISIQEERLELQIIDHTQGFDWQEAQLPTPEAEHGRGLFIIQSLMDEVVYLRSRDENRLVMRKCRISDGKGRKLENQKSEGEAQKKLALTEQAIGTMAKELCFRSEELAAIFRCTSELGRTNNLQDFSRRLLKDLLHIASADWFVLRLLARDGFSLAAVNVSEPGRKVAPLAMPGARQPSHAYAADPWRSGSSARLKTNDQSSSISRLRSMGSAERRAALSRQDVEFGQHRPLSSDDPLASVRPGCVGLVRPLVMGGDLLGTLAVGRTAGQPPFSSEQVEAIHTFSDFLAIQIVNTRLHEEHLDTRLTSHELEIARKIQQSLLPKTFPALPGFGLAGFCVSARQVGGDFYDVLPLPGERALLVVADVMGKGVPAALFAATLRTLIRTMAEWTTHPSELLARINRLMFEELSAVDMFITATVGLLEARERRLIVASAGHCPLLLTDKTGFSRAVSPEGMPLGIVAGADFSEEVVPLDSFSCALLYSDGLTEARNAHGEFFGEERLLKWLSQKSSRRETATELSNHFLRELNSFQGQISLSDDQTFLILAEETAQPARTEALETRGIGAAVRASLAAR